MENEFVFVFLFFFYSYQKCVFISLKCDLVFLCFVIMNPAMMAATDLNIWKEKLRFCSMKRKNEK